MMAADALICKDNPLHWLLTHPFYQILGRNQHAPLPVPLQPHCDESSQNNHEATQNSVSHFPLPRPRGPPSCQVSGNPYERKTAKEIRPGVRGGGGILLSSLHQLLSPLPPQNPSSLLPFISFLHMIFHYFSGDLASLASRQGRSCPPSAYFIKLKGLQI